MLPYAYFTNGGLPSKFRLLVVFLMSTPLISVLIPCHNYGRFVGEAIDSIRQQTYANWQVLVIDDGSSDDTQAVVAPYCLADARIKYYYQEQQGVSAARNLGFVLATGEYVQLLDADDVLSTHKFERQLAVFSEHPTAILVYGETYSFKEQREILAGEIKKFIFHKQPVSGSGTELALQMADDNLFLPCGALFKKNMLQLSQGFNPAIVAFEDWEFWYKAVLKGAEFVYDDRAGTASYARAHGNNTTRNRYKMWKSKVEVRKAIMNRLTTMLRVNEKTTLNLPVILRRHEALRYEETARFNMLYANVLVGLLDTVRYSLKGEKPVRIWYDSAYWLKERLLGRK